MLGGLLRPRPPCELLTIHANNHLKFGRIQIQRLIRALEVFALLGTSLSQLHRI